MPIEVAAQNRMLNHVETVFRPGEKELAKNLFELLGCRVVDKGGTGFAVHADGDVPSKIYNIIYASEISLEQWHFEEALRRQVEGGGELGQAYDGFRELVGRLPYKATHFGIRLDTAERFEETLGRLETLDASELAGRARVATVFRPGDPDSPITFMCQAFVETDVVAAGLLCLGQRIEICAPAG